MESPSTPDRPGQMESPAEVLRALGDLWQASAAPSLGVSQNDFARLLLAVGSRYRFGQPRQDSPLPAAREQIRFLRQLCIDDLVLAHACAEGREAAWERFMAAHRSTLYQAAYRLAGSDAQARDLADSLYADLYGLREKDGRRQSPLRGYHGRGSLAAWLRTVLAQRFVDHYRRHRRETPLEEISESAAAPDPPTEDAPPFAQAGPLLRSLVEHELARLDPEERFLLTAYYFDGRTLRELAALLTVHASTVSRRLERLTARLRKRIFRGLRAAGMDRRRAGELMELDVRDLDIPVRKILQISAAPAFPTRETMTAEGGGTHV